MQSPPGDRHGWNSLNHYLSIHESILGRFREFFIESEALQINVISENTLTIKGRIACVGRLYLDVHKILEINEREQVRTIRYSYQACIDREPPQRIFRYDNAHTYVREGHADDHHKHVFNVDTGEESRASPVWIGYDR